MSIAIIFNGQGAQFKGMGLDFIEKFPEAQKVFEDAEKLTNYPIRKWLTDDFDKLGQTQYAQVAISTTSLAIYKSIESHLPAIDYMAGLSLGEYSALIASEILDFDEGMLLIKERGQLMTAHCEKLRESSEIVMEAVLNMPLEEIEDVVEIVNQAQEEEILYVANINSSTQVTIAGTEEATTAFKKIARDRGFRRVMPLKVEGPFHSPYMEAVCDPYAKYLTETSFHPGTAAVISNVTVEPHTSENIKASLMRHIVEPVRWKETIDYLVENGVTKVIQIGPGKTLANLLKREENVPKALVIDKVEDIAEIESFIGG
jgi:[acyl-carrier-protein] S-malonyltransferase